MAEKEWVPHDSPSGRGSMHDPHTIDTLVSNETLASRFSMRPPMVQLADIQGDTAHHATHAPGTYPGCQFCAAENTAGELK